jgi:thiosulfate/3-mercaptopyruvate sulfurtransferase
VRLAPAESRSTRRRARQDVLARVGPTHSSVDVSLLCDLEFKDATLYKPGWLGYAGALSAPAADETFVNMGALNHHIRSLEARVDKLEKKIAEGKERK